MIHPYQLHSLSKIYRQEALQMARVRHIGHRTKAPRRPRSETQGLRSRLGKLAAVTVRLS